MPKVNKVKLHTYFTIEYNPTSPQAASFVKGNDAFSPLSGVVHTFVAGEGSTASNGGGYAALAAAYGRYRVSYAKLRVQAYRIGSTDTTGGRCMIAPVTGTAALSATSHQMKNQPGMKMLIQANSNEGGNPPPITAKASSRWIMSPSRAMSDAASATTSGVPSDRWAFQIFTEGLDLTIPVSSQLQCKLTQWITFSERNRVLVA